MSELATAVVLSQSGLTRLVDRLVRDGSVARVRCEGDRRGLNAELTDAGRRRYRGGARRPTLRACEADSSPISAPASWSILGALLGTRLARALPQSDAPR